MTRSRMFLQTSVSALCSAQTSEGVLYSAQALMSWNRFECKKVELEMFTRCSFFFTTSIVVHTEWQAAAVHTEGQCGPNSGPPCPCPSGWVAQRWRCCPPNRAGCRSCCPATSSGSERESPASRGRLSSWPGWAVAGGRTPASWVSPGG